MNKNIKMYNPPHPAAILREDILPELGITKTEASRQLGISRAMFSRVLNEHASITPDMALRLEKWLGVKNGGRADTWLAQQSAYDLWQARQKWTKTNPKVTHMLLKGV